MGELGEGNDNVIISRIITEELAPALSFYATTPNPFAKYTCMRLAYETAFLTFSIYNQDIAAAFKVRLQRLEDCLHNLLEASSGTVTGGQHLDLQRARDQQYVHLAIVYFQYIIRRIRNSRGVANRRESLKKDCKVAFVLFKALEGIDNMIMTIPNFQEIREQYVEVAMIAANAWVADI